jgi:hypothetical protein
MTVDSLRFDGTVFDHTDTALGEARFWASAERGAAGSSWRGWIRVTDLGTNEMAIGRYRVRSSEGWEAEFEPLAGRPSRVFEIDLLPIQGAGEAPWPDQSESTAPRYQPLWNDSPPRVADDHAYFPDLSPLGLTPHEGLLSSDLSWAPVPDGSDSSPS